MSINSLKLIILSPHRPCRSSSLSFEQMQKPYSVHSATCPLLYQLHYPYQEILYTEAIFNDLSIYPCSTRCNCFLCGDLLCRRWLLTAH